MANLLVTTSNPDERTRLQEQFSIRDKYFEVPREASSTLEAIFRAISFEYFQNTPPPLAHKIIVFAENTINGQCSLTLLRQIISSVKAIQDLLTIHQKYFWSINQEIGDQHLASQDLGLSQDYSLAEENDRLFQLAERGEMRFTRTLDTTDFHQTYEITLKQHYPLAASEKTQLPSDHRPNPQERQIKETLQNSCKQSHIFYTAEAYYGNDWWKQERGNDSSKEISRFDCKAGNPFNQKSIGRLVIQEFKYDLNREIQLGKDINRHQDVEAFKYRKMMKDKLLNAKLKKKKKK